MNRIFLKKRQGQVVLLIVMMLAVITTVALTLSFRAQSNTQLNKVNEQSVRLKEAAEAGVELGFGQSSASLPIRTFRALGYTSPSLLPGVDVDKSRIIVSDSPSDTSLVTPILGVNNMFTFYLVPVQTLQPLTFTQTSFPNALNVFYNDQGSTSCSTAAYGVVLEFTVIADMDSGPGNSYKVLPRYMTDGANIIDPDNSNDVNKATGAHTLPIGSSGLNATFHCLAQLPQSSLANGRVLLVRMLSRDPTRKTRLGFEDGRAAANHQPLPIQKRSVRSEVWSTDGVLSITMADQSYPQLPADFFVTAF